MAELIGRQAVVIGAGMGGLTAARAVADHFERVLVLERDALPADPLDRHGVPQGRHVHALLAGGQRALSELFPGFEKSLEAAGAVRLRVGLDIRVDRPGYDPFPQRDLGFDAFAMSRPLVELTVRRRAQETASIELRTGCQVQGLVPSPDGTGVTGVRYTSPSGTEETVAADLVIDASGRGTPTLDALAAMGRTAPAETTIGVDLGYASAVFAIPDDAPKDWKGAFCLPGAGRASRGSLMLPLEDHRWIATVGGRHGDQPPGDEAAFMEYAQALRTQTIYSAIKHAKRLGEIARFRFNESVLRHYQRLESFPRGVLPIGDAICRFNPIYGQGMSVAAQEAVALRRLLVRGVSLAELAREYFAQVSRIVETPWAQAAIPDFVHPDTRGERPADFEQTLKFGMGLGKLAASDPAIHRLTSEVQHLLKPRSVFQDPELVQRVMAIVTRRPA
ncbi:MAG TPA: FAD-dependent monooxygenase [Methylomirabilota bacterium]|nr:FAD-dependent monooxygenase [Methylomirabilota bacterium]